MSDNNNPVIRDHRKDVRWLAGVAGITAIGSVAGVSVARSVQRRGGVDDPYADEDFATLDADRGCVVTAADGV